MLVLMAVFVVMFITMLVLMAAHISAVTALGAVLRIVAMGRTVLAVGAMDVFRPVRVAVRMCVHDLRVRQEFFPAGAFGKA